MKRDPFKVAFMWFIFVVYGVPTVFMVIVTIAGVNPAPWWMIAWGGVATLLGVLFGEGKQRAER